MSHYSLFPQGINIVEPSNAEPTPRPPSPAMYQLDIVLKKGNNLAIRDRTGKGSVSFPLSVLTVAVIKGADCLFIYIKVHQVQEHKFVYFLCCFVFHGC